ncbi:MAG: dienelactone hydrolase family protein [Bacteroidales bacterium]|nr:dienelactone hydrolase family protein [Bacteroidales bacterium]MBQ2483283.1 dienelactone hydrolase family protein [Bacteroidales bacterium]MBQ4197547.1 dienelactone hydrolase family protein [Bacteroidales bacterium]
MKVREPVLRAMRKKVEGSYSFWLYTPAGYDRKDTLCKDIPLVLFLHGKSLCGNDLEKVRRYGSIDCVERGRHIPALVVAPQNPGEWWNPDKLCKILDYLKTEYPYDTARVYVLGMSLGGYGTLDFVAAKPERVAAALALCGGTTAKDVSPMGQVPLWIIHGTADKLVSVKASQVIVKDLEQKHLASRLRYEWLIGASHSYLARYFYMPKVYDWLLSHSLLDEGRPVNRDVKITKEDQNTVYSGWGKRPELKTIR